MPIVDMKGMFDHAYHNGYAIGAFGVPFDANVALTRTVTEVAHSCGYATLPDAGTHVAMSKR